METIQFTYANFRYLMFERGGQYYLLDRRPRYMIGYLFLPLNWFFHQKVYAITADDYFKIQEKLNKKAKFSFPVSIGSGLGVFVASLSRVTNFDKNFETDFSIEINSMLALVGILLAYLLIELFYDIWKKSLNALFPLDNRFIAYCQVRPSYSVLQYAKMIGFRLFFFMLFFGITLIYLTLGNWLMWLGSIFMLWLFFLSVNLNFIPREDVQYKIIDIKSNAKNSNE
ncbi:TPA: DUF443 family protein [Streptococcus mutans]